MNIPTEINKITLYSKHKHLIHFIIGVFFLEFCTMLAMDFLPPLPLITKSLIDSLSLMIILFPVVYFLVIRPENKYNLERERANDALKESELKFRKYIDFAPHGVFVANENGEYVEVNAAASTITGFSKEELLSMKIMDTVPEESIEGALNHFNKVVSEGYASDELSFTRKDNSKGHWSVDAVKLSNNLFLGFVTDISERTKAEKKLSESEELFRTLAGNIPQLCWMTNAEGYIFWYNQRWYDYTGTTPEQMEGWGWKSVHHPDHVDHVIESWTSALKDQGPWEDTFPLRSASGEYGWFLSRAFPIRNEKGEIVRWFGTNTDITKRLKTEESLAQAKEEWECTFNAIPDLIAIIDSNHKIVRANKAMAERMGLNENQCGEVECFKAIHNMDHVPAFCPHSQTVQDGCLHEVEIFEQQLNGDFIVTTTPLMNPNGELMGSVHVAHDITNRKKMEDLLRESEERYKSIFVKSLSVMMLIDPDTAEIKDVNQAACDYYGWSNDEFLTKYISDINLIPRGKVISSMQNAKNEVQNHFIFKHRMATGELRDVEVYSCPLEFNGKVALFSIIHDITESKKLEEALRESEYFFRESQRAGFIGSYKTDFVKNSWESSEVLDQIFGIERNYFKDFNSFLDIIHPDDRMEIRLFMTDETLSKGIEFNHEFKIIRKNDEETRWVHGLGKIGYDENHNVISLVGTIQDITDRKKNEEELKNSEEHLKALYTSMNEGLVNHTVVYENEKAVDYRIDDSNPAFEKLTGLDRNSSIGKTASELYGTEESPYLDIYARVAETGKPDYFETYFPPMDKHFAISVFSPGKGTFATIFTDITQRKKDENALQRLNQTLSVLNKSSHAMALSVEENKYLQQVCNIVVEDCGFKMVWIGYSENDEAKSVLPVASAGFDDDYLDTIRLSWGDDEFGRGPTGTAIRTGKISSCRNMLTDPAFEPWREQAVKCGYASSIVFPLIMDEHAFGAITIYSSETDPFNEDQVDMLSKLANDMAHGITTIRLREAHQKAEIALRESHENLEELVKLRTHELQFTNDLLIKEINIRKQKEQNLKLTEEKYRTVADYNYDWETWLGPDGKYVYVSPSCESITGYSVDEFMKNSSLFFEITHPDDREMVESHASDSIKGIVDDCSKDFRIITKEGEERWIGHNCQPVYNAKGMFIGQRGSNRDITQRKKTERILIDSQRHLRELTQRMDIITEEERIRIAREIHDELGHLLTALKYDVESLINNTNLSEDLIKNELNGMISMIEALIDSVRKIATELRPGILDHLGLFPAIEWQISQFRLKNKINCEYAISEFDIDFDKNETTIIYRILQEIFTNITRHSKAKHVWVSIDKKDEYFILKVVDNGVGFVKNADSNTGSLGLMGMRERAMSIGGEIKIESELGKGTAIVFELKK